MFLQGIVNYEAYKMLPICERECIFWRLLHSNAHTKLPTNSDDWWKSKFYKSKLLEILIENEGLFSVRRTKLD